MISIPEATPDTGRAVARSVHVRGGDDAQALVPDAARRRDATRAFAPIFHHPMRNVAKARPNAAGAWEMEEIEQ